MLPPKRPPAPPASGADRPPHFTRLLNHGIGIGRIARHVDQRLVAAGVVEAGGDQVLHAAHIAERHGRAGPAIVTARSSRHVIGQISPVWFL